MEEQAIDEEGIWKTLEKALRGAAEGLSQTRITEGENLKEDLISKLDAFASCHDGLSVRKHQRYYGYELGLSLISHLILQSRFHFLHLRRRMTPWLGVAARTPP